MDNSDIKVLLVDDDELVRNCMVDYLEDEGFSVYCVASGADALECIVSIAPAVCISDMLLPGMNGEEFIIRAHVLCPATGYIIHTGMIYPLSDELRTIGMTPDDVLLKPIHDLSKLVNKIKHIAAAGRLV
jgi:CheY-like chemotaxis protein